MREIFDLEGWRQLARYLGLALELSDAELATWLAELAKTHPDFARAIGEMLADRQRLDAGGFLMNFPNRMVLRRRPACLLRRLLGLYRLQRLQ